MMSVSDVLGSTGPITWAQECVRALIIFVYGLALVRITGRRVFARWSALDVIVSIVVGSNLSRALTGNASLGGTLAATTLLMALHWVLAHFASRLTWFASVVEGRPIRLASKGETHRSAMLHHLVSEHDLHEALRQSGVERVEDTGLIVLEPSGKINVLKAG